MDKISFYIGSGYTVESGCEAIISCAGKLHSNCKFFPAVTWTQNRHTYDLAVSSNCYAETNWELKGWRWTGSSWHYFLRYGDWDPWRGWRAFRHTWSPSVNNVVIKIVPQWGTFGGHFVDVEPAFRYEMFGYVPVSMRPESEWGIDESAWIHAWLLRMYGRED